MNTFKKEIFLSFTNIGRPCTILEWRAGYLVCLMRKNSINNRVFKKKEGGSNRIEKAH